MPCVDCLGNVNLPFIFFRSDMARFTRGYLQICVRMDADTEPTGTYSRRICKYPRVNRVSVASDFL